MPEWKSEIVAALIGLAGTLAVALFGYRQWRLTHRDSAKQDLAKTKKLAYTELWSQVEQIHWELRQGPGYLDKLPARLRELNAFILKNEIYLADGDHELVNKYLAALKGMVDWIEREGDSALKAEMHATAPIPEEAVNSVEVFVLREALKERVKRAIEVT